jgi:hypothetical protein
VPAYPLAGLAMVLARQLTKSELETPDPRAAFLQLKRVPFLAIGGDQDKTCPVDKMRAAYGTADGVRRRLEILPGKTHAALLSAESPDVRHKIREFLLEWLGSD